MAIIDTQASQLPRCNGKTTDCYRKNEASGLEPDILGRWRAMTKPLFDKCKQDPDEHQAYYRYNNWVDKESECGN
jgi:hypothetical protein